MTSNVSFIGGDVSGMDAINCNKETTDSSVAASNK